ncbi:MAG: hypothetical protein ACLRXB_01300 [Escherichia coli]
MLQIAKQVIDAGEGIGASTLEALLALFPPRLKMLEGSQAFTEKRQPYQAR